MARGLQLLRTGGQFSYIVSDTWRTIKTHRPLRRRLLDTTTVSHVLDLPAWIFEATVNTCVLTLTKRAPADDHHVNMGDLRGITSEDWVTMAANLVAVATHGVDVQTTAYARYTFPQSLISAYDNLSFFVGSPRLYRLMSDSRFVRSGNIVEVKQGMATGDNRYYLRKRSEAQGNYVLLDESKLLTGREIDALTPEEKICGVDPSKYEGRHFVPYDKGGASDAEGGWLPNYYVPTHYFIDWSFPAVERIKTRRSDRQRGNVAGRFQNAAYYFRQGITFSDTGFYAPTFRFGCAGVFDVMGMTIFTSELPTDWLLGILSSRLVRYIIKNFVNHTVHTQVEGLKPIPIPMEGADAADRLSLLVREIVEKQKSDPRYPYHLHEQSEIDALVYQLYGLADDDIREVELWYCRRYPKLAEAQGALADVTERFSDHLARCERVLSEPPSYWRSHPVLALIARGEGPELELKETLEVDVSTGEKNPGVLHSALKSITAFLNSDGGTLLIGVSDSGEIKGLARDFAICNKHDSDGFEQKLRSLLSSRFTPQPLGRVDITFESLPEGEACRLNIEPSPSVVHLDGKDVYVRDGNVSRKLEGPALTNWIEQKATN